MDANVNQINFGDIETSIFLKTTSFRDRLNALSVQPIESEADLLAFDVSMSELITDMQAFSTNTMEGPKRGSISGVPGNGRIESSAAASAPGRERQNEIAGIGAPLQ